MKAVYLLLALIFAAAPAVAQTTSTVDPTVPATGSTLSSANVRNNFAATASDINRLYGIIQNTVPGVLVVPATECSFTASGSGSAARGCDKKLGDIVSVLDFATGNGTTDDTAKINQAIAAVPANGTLYFPCGTYLVSGSGTDVFLLTKSINIVGAGRCASFTGTIGNSTDLFHVRPGAGVVLRGIRFSNFALNTTGASSFFHLDTNASSTSEIADVQVDRVFAPNAPALHSVFVDNPSTNLNGGTFNAKFGPLNYFTSSAGNGAVWMNYAGDTLHVFDNILTGNGYAIYVNQIATGAGNFIAERNNITALYGIRVDGGIFPIVARNEIELASGASVTGALVSFAGAVGGIDGGLITDNMIQTIGSTTGIVENIYVGSAANVGIDRNRNATTLSGVYGINVSASAAGTMIGCGETTSGFNANLLDGSTSTTTCGGVSGGTIPFLNSAPFNTFSNTGGKIAAFDTSGLAVGVGGQVLLQALNSGAVAASYAAVRAYATGGGAGTEAGDLTLQAARSGVLTDIAYARSYGGFRIVPRTFAALPACTSGEEGASSPITDSTVATWGTTIAGGGTNHVLAYCDGTSWTVAAK